MGDRYVMAKMRDIGANLGGEQSGHIIFNDYTTTGDGILAALQVLAAIVEKGKKASEVLNVFEPWPQILKNVKIEGKKNPLENAKIKKLIDAAEKDLGKNGRLVIRKSGTEPLIRIMAEGVNKKQIEKISSDIEKEISSAA